MIDFYKLVPIQIFHFPNFYLIFLFKSKKSWIFLFFGLQFTVYILQKELIYIIYI